MFVEIKMIVSDYDVNSNLSKQMTKLLNNLRPGKWKLGKQVNPK